MKYFKKILKYFVWLVGAIVILLIALYFFIQTDTFDKWALDYSLKKLNESESWIKKENYISAESINGNLLNGLRINNIVLTVKKDTLVSIKYLDLKYDIWGLLKQKISLDYVILNSPEVNLTKIKDGADSLVWSFTNLFSTSTDTTSSPFNWNIYVNSLRIENGKFRIFGDIPSKPLWALQWEKQDEFNYNELDISDFQLDMTGEYSNKFKKINVRNLSFNSNTNIILKKLSFDAFINIQDTITEISNLELYTNRSDIKIIKFSANALNPLDSNALDKYGDKNISVILNIERFNFADLKYFLPSVDMLDSTLSLYLDANGIYKNLNINNLKLNLPNSEINLKGNVQNLSNLDSLYFDVSTNSKIDPADIKTILKIKSIPHYRRLGVVLADIDYKGNYNDFYSEFNIRTSNGNIKGQVHLNIDEKSYSGNIITNNLNLAPILNDKKLKSNINLSANFEGSGFSPKNMSTKVRYNLKNSGAAGYSIISSSGTVNIYRNNMRLNIKANSYGGNTAVSGNINISNMKNPVYSLKGNMSNVDISRFSKNEKDKSNLNASFDINGSGISMNDLAGRFDIDVGNSIYSQYEIPETKVFAEQNKNSDNSSIQLTNKAMEIKADGTFAFSSLIESVLYNISLISNIAKKKIFPDSNFIYNDLSQYDHTGNINLNYNIITKDSSELRKLTSPFGIDFNGNINGRLTNSSEGFNSNSIVFIKNFSYQDTSIILNNFKGNILLTNDYLILNENNPLASFKINMDVNADRIWFDSNKFDSLNTLFRLSESMADINLKVKMDSVKYTKLKSNINLREDNIVFNVDSLYVKFNNYELVNDNKWIVNYLPQQEINISKLGLKSGNMVLNVDGKYSFAGQSDLNIKGENLNLGNIYEMIRPFDTTSTGEKNVYPVQGEFQKLYINLKGTPENLMLNLDVKSNLLKYDTVGIGTITASIAYKDQIFSPDISITNNENKGNLKIKGNIPIENLFIKRDTLAAVADKKSDLNLVANNFQIQYFTKLIPGIGDLQGILNGNIKAGGTYQNPELIGNLTMVKGKYLLDFTGMYYDYDFKISTENSKLVIDKIRLYNPDDDSRHIDVTGNIDFKGYNLNDINLTTSGDMVLLDKSNQENRLGLKGYLLGGIGNPPVTITGNLDKLNVKGQFLLKEATLAAIPDNGKGYQLDDKNIIYLSANDSAYVTDTNRRKISLLEYQNVNPFLRNRYILIDTTKSITLLKMLALDLSVKTERNLNVSLDFKNITRDRLFGEIQADLRIRSVRGRLIANGEANVVGNSYYRFYRDFKVKESKIIFRGPIDKPELDIRAVYANTKSKEQFGTITNSPIQVVLTAKGDPSDPEITLKLYENGTEMLGNDATSDAITFLLFGKYKNELSASESQSVATGIGSTLGSLYVTSFFGQVVRDVVPFIKDAELNYTEGGIQNTNVNVSSDLFGANITVGSRVIKNNAYLEFNVEYPLNNIININLPEKVLLQFAREQLSSSVITNMSLYYSTGLKVIYKLKF